MTFRGMEFRKETSAGFMTNQLARLFARELARDLKPLGLAPAQFMVLADLWESGPRTQRQLVGRLAVEQATMAGTLTRMERDGLVERMPNPSDGRSQLVQPTPRGMALREAATQAAAAINTRALSALAEPERAAYLDMLDRMTAALRDGEPTE